MDCKNFTVNFSFSLHFRASVVNYKSGGGEGDGPFRKITIFVCFVLKGGAGCPRDAECYNDNSGGRDERKVRKITFFI